MSATDLPPQFTDAMQAHADAAPSCDERPVPEGFNVVSLGAWLDLCKAAGVDAVPATKIGDIEIAHLIETLDYDPDRDWSSDTGAAQTRAFWTKIEAAKKPGTMIRWDCCACAEVKYRLGTGRPEWHQDLLDCFYIDDFRATDLIFEYPDTIIAAWSRPWMRARIVDGYPVEYRVFVEDARIIGVSSYYPQRPLPDTPEVREDIAACLAEADKLIAALPTPLRHPGGLHTDRSPESKSFTADFMRLEDGRFLYLEGGPPFSPASGAHPCCFEHFDNWHDGASFHLSGVPVALEAAPREESQ
ncbi:MAG: hypothetical protein F4X35_03835 [Alphaproteobacteria bacterium]|nr:hypothetical protein [Alphaproteobacteria bacterium]